MSLTNSQMRTLSEKVVHQSLRIGKKSDGTYDSVRIIYNKTDSACCKFTEMVEEECWKVGAHTALIPQSNKRNKLFYSVSPEDSLKMVNPLTKALVETMDVYLYIWEDDDPNWSRGISDKLKVDAANRQQIRGIIDNRKVRWLRFGWPITGTAKRYGIPVNRFKRIFFKSIKESFSEKLLRLCRYYHDALIGHDMVKIEADDGTDLSFSIKDRRILVDDGIISDEDRTRGEIGLNIPSGEVYVAPIEDSAQGKIYFDNVTLNGFGKAKDLLLQFEKGKVVDFRARFGRENFGRFLDANSGEKDRIAELGIGCNQGAEYTNGVIIIDEKIYRTIHIAIGNNIGSYQGKNSASSHLDMIKFMQNGRLYVDGKLVMNKGEPAAAFQS